MNLGMVRGLLEQVGKRRASCPWSSRSSSSEQPEQDSRNSSYSMSTQPSEASGEGYHQAPNKFLSDTEMLYRARSAHSQVDFNGLSAGPNAGGPWKRVESANRFVIFRGVETSKTCTGPEVLCAGRVDATIEEVVSILCPHSEAEHNAVMTGLHGKRYLFGSLERCIDIDSQEEEITASEHLAVKTSSFARSSLFGAKEQWCYTDSFQRKTFTWTPRVYPARISGPQARVDQLHDLTTAYLVDLDPASKGLRVVFNAKFFNIPNQSDSIGSNSTSPSSPTVDTSAEIKAQSRRLLVLARGVAKIPELVRCRRFGFQVPADFDVIQVSNPRCTCCTRSFSSVKMSLSVAASAISNRSLASLKTDTRRCYLCGYLVCIDCWSAERMETMAGRVAAIVVCKRCQASVDACNYSDIAADRNHGPARVVEDPPESTKASLLVDFLADSLDQAPVGSQERSDALSVVRSLLSQDEEGSSEEESDCDDTAILEDKQFDAESMAKVDEFLNDETKFPLLDACKLGNADRRSYVLDLPDDPENSVPRSPIPENEGRRLSAAESAGLLVLADELAPSEPRETPPKYIVNVCDLELIYQLAVMTLGSSDAMISVMGATHEHILASPDLNFTGAAVPRDYTMCQHQVMSKDPLVLIHPEADVRLQAVQTVKLMSLRSYIGFPITAPELDSLDGDQIAVGTLCCIDNKPHHELTRSQFATMQYLARTASYLVQQKGLQLQQKAAPAS